MNIKTIFLFLFVSSIYSVTSHACRSNSWCGDKQICDRAVGSFGRKARVGTCVDDPSYSKRGGFGRYKRHGECGRFQGCKSNEICTSEGYCVESRSDAECNENSDCGSGQICNHWGFGKRTCVNESAGENSSSTTKLPWPTKNQPKKDKVKSTGKRYAKYNRCMKKNRKVKPVSKRIDMCAHLRN